MVLVGDSLAMVVLGHRDTLSVTVDEMAHHTAAVARGGDGVLVVGDLPWMSYHNGTERAVDAAAQLVRAGATAVKLEGGARRRAVIESIIDAEIPVMGHLGLTPQSVRATGGYKVQACEPDAVRQLVADARALEQAGCFAVVLEAVPHEVGTLVTETVSIPTIGIGAGPGCDGQVLVLHDVLGLDIEAQRMPRFVRRYGELGLAAVDHLTAWVDDVRHGRFPTQEHCYRLDASQRHALEALLASDPSTDLRELAFVGPWCSSDEQ